VDGEEATNFPVTVYGKELLQVEASVPAGELMLCRITFPDFAE